MDVIEFVRNDLIKEQETGRELLYLCEFGSHLYGTDTPDSDIDYKGVFLPSKKEMLLGNKCKSLHYSSGKNDDRNTKEDVDVDLWSLQYFFFFFFKEERNAIKLLF